LLKSKQEFKKQLEKEIETLIQEKKLREIREKSKVQKVHEVNEQVKEKLFMIRRLQD